MPKQPKCPVCGEPPSRAEQIETDGTGEFPIYMDGVLHCPNEHDALHEAVSEDRNHA